MPRVHGKGDPETGTHPAAFALSLGALAMMRVSCRPNKFRKRQRFAGAITPNTASPATTFAKQAREESCCRLLPYGSSCGHYSLEGTSGSDPEYGCDLAVIMTPHRERKQPIIQHLGRVRHFRHCSNVSVIRVEGSRRRLLNV